jgi:RP/EB family microtubule-associated protein
MSTGAAYCQLTDFVFPKRVPMKKVKWNSRQEVDWLANWGILQRAWKEIGIDKVGRSKEKMMCTFEFSASPSEKSDARQIPG